MLHLGGARARSKMCLQLAGQLPLSELPGLLTRCALFVGNDSGPKHIAAGMGVPRLGITGSGPSVRVKRG
jgi:heptosyltransferase-3